MALISRGVISLHFFLSHTVILCSHELSICWSHHDARWHWFFSATICPMNQTSLVAAILCMHLISLGSTFFLICLLSLGYISWCYLSDIPKLLYGSATSATIFCGFYILFCSYFHLWLIFQCAAIFLIALISNVATLYHNAWDISCYSLFLVFCIYIPWCHHFLCGWYPFLKLHVYNGHLFGISYFRHLWLWLWYSLSKNGLDISWQNPYSNLGVSGVSGVLCYIPYPYSLYIPWCNCLFKALISLGT